MQYRRMPIEIESPEQLGYETIRNNLSESSYTDAVPGNIAGLMDGLEDLLLCYGSHQGHEGLRELLAKDSQLPQKGIPQLSKDDVLITTGAAEGLFIIATALLEKGDELIVARPNYATNIETPRAIGAQPRFLDLRFEDRFSLDPEVLEKCLSKKTKYISVTYPHNPTGACLTEEELKALARIAEKHQIILLVDETYRDMVFGVKPPMACTFSENVITVSSVSKTYGLPGLRVGWIICRNHRLMETLLAAKEQIHICGPVIDEEISFRYLQRREEHAARIMADIREKFGIVKSWMEGQDMLEWVEPKGGAVCLPRIKYPDKVDLDRFYGLLLSKYGTYAGPGHWFEMPRHYMRIGFGWPAKERLQEGLESISKCLEEARSLK